MAIRNQTALAQRARNLGAFNGINFVLVRLNPAVNPVEAKLTVYFFNKNEIANLLAAPPAATFPISGGVRVKGGLLAGQIQTTAVAGASTNNFIELTVSPIGDYSVYTLSIDHPNIDPLFSSIKFKFRPGCFNTDCSPDWTPAEKAKVDPEIDYLNKDYDSFRHTMMAAMGARVPGWRPTSEADLDQVLIDLIAASADELSDFQDRVVQEGYLGTARRRVSLARHARLMDYHIHQGNQAVAWLALELAPAQAGMVAKGTLIAQTGVSSDSPTTQTFVNHDDQYMDALVNRISLYTWSDAQPSLEAGCTTADLKLSLPGKLNADAFVAMFTSGKITRLLIEEWLNPSTGQPADRDPNKRQILNLASAVTMQDPVTTDYFVRVTWQPEDALAVNYCFTISCPAKVENVSLFHGNLVRVFHGVPRHLELDDPSAVSPGAFPYTLDGDRGVICNLPPEPIAYLDTPPGGDTPPESTLAVQVQTTSGIETWEEHADLIHSEASDKHFRLETDENLQSRIVFGDGVNGMKLPDLARVLVDYQAGLGLDGNVGADRIGRLVNPPALLTQATCWNPLAAQNGRAPETVESIVRRAPEMFRTRQLRAVTLADYVNRAQELPEVSRAAASYAWTGSWRTVRIAIDPAGGLTLDTALREKLESHLNAVRLIGEDLELRPPRFVPLEIHVTICVSPDFWPEDLRFLVEQEFSTGYTADGRMAFFHPDAWTFGQPLYASEIYGRLQAIPGVEHVLNLRMKRWNTPFPETSEAIFVRTEEIILVASDPSRMEEGYIDFVFEGGRQ